MAKFAGGKVEAQSTSALFTGSTKSVWTPFEQTAISTPFTRRLEVAVDRDRAEQECRRKVEKTDSQYRGGGPPQNFQHCRDSPKLSIGRGRWAIIAAGGWPNCGASWPISRRQGVEIVQ